ncbi:hypothetical protein F5Y15DRAFT_37070 [Xylariaceae sp. FL0016]|nr:hypothetical protein F5Y15DRAFT_37070 [Xylariaceae sp. FL0016]
MNWWNYSLAATQATFINTAYEPNGSMSLEYRTRFNTSLFQILCNSQKIQTSKYSSFSLFGVVFIFATGLAIVFTSYLLEPISELLFSRMGYKQYQHLEWTTNETYQLQRLAHEELGLGVWSHGTSTVPTPAADEILGCLDITDRKHPVLRHPRDKRMGSSRPTASSRVSIRSGEENNADEDGGDLHHRSSEDRQSTNVVDGKTTENDDQGMKSVTADASDEKSLVSWDSDAAPITVNIPEY